MLHYDITINYSVRAIKSVVWIEEILVGSVKGEGHRCTHQSYLDNGSTGERQLLLRRIKPQESPFSRWGCVSRAEAIRPAIILHLLSSIATPQPETRLPPNPEDQTPTVARKTLTGHDATK